MAGEEAQTFEDVLENIQDYADDESPIEGEESLNDLDGTPDESPEPETPEAPLADTPEDKPEEGGEEGEKAAEDPEAPAEADKPEETPEADTPKESLPDDTVVGQDDHGNPITLGELRKGYLRQDDYTRKRQEESQRLKDMEAQIGQERELAKLVATDEYAREFVELFPKHADRLFKDPATAIELIKDRSRFEGFIKRVNALDEDPALAEAYIDSQTQQSASAELDRRVAADEVSQFGVTLQKAIMQAAEGFEGADPEAVAAWLVEAAGASQDKIAEAFNAGDPLRARDDMAKIATLVTRQVGDKYEINMALLKSRFEYEALKAGTGKAAEAEHNASVDKQLAAQKDAPAGHVAGEAAEGLKPEDLSKKYDNLDDFLNREDGPLALG